MLYVLENNPEKREKNKQHYSLIKNFTGYQIKTSPPTEQEVIYDGGDLNEIFNSNEQIEYDGGSY